jgi:parallel beta helix pectate lyase-like protein
MRTRHVLPAAVLVAVLIAPGAAAAQPTCGQVVTQSITLEANLVCPDGPAPALVVGAPGITIDLGGHGISGDLNVGGGVGIGIDGRGGHDGVRIRNGTIGGFGRGIVLRDASSTRMRDLAVSGVGSTAITIEGGAGNAVVESEVRARSTGIAVTGSNGMRVARSAVAAFFFTAIELNGSSDGAIVDNTLGRDATGAVVVAGSGNRVAGNIVRGALVGGHITVAAGTGNVVDHNWVVGSRATSFTSDEDGIVVASGARGTRVADNVSVAAGDDGIDVEDPTARVARNTANDDGDLGIEAVAGVRGSGNRAARNGNPAQCTGVSCGA